jgi:hypothetical protein
MDLAVNKSTKFLGSYPPAGGREFDPPLRNLKALPMAGLFIRRFYEIRFRQYIRKTQCGEEHIT